MASCLFAAKPFAMVEVLSSSDFSNYFEFCVLPCLVLSLSSDSWQENLNLATPQTEYGRWPFHHLYQLSVASLLFHFAVLVLQN